MIEFGIPSALALAFGFIYIFAGAWLRKRKLTRVHRSIMETGIMAILLSCIACTGLRVFDDVYAKMQAQHDLIVKYDQDEYLLGTWDRALRELLMVPGSTRRPVIPDNATERIVDSFKGIENCSVQVRAAIDKRWMSNLLILLATNKRYGRCKPEVHQKDIFAFPSSGGFFVYGGYAERISSDLRSIGFKVKTGSSAENSLVPPGAVWIDISEGSVW